MQKAPSIFILLLLVSFGSVSAVLYTPALPQIAHELALSQNAAQLTVTLFLIGYALGTLPYGPLADRFGRKVAAYLGICIAILGGLLILFVKASDSFPLFLIGRLLMALGGSVGVQIAFTIVGDSYQHEKATKVITYLMLSFAIAPSLAIAVGGFLTTYLGWMSCFYFLIGYSLFLLLLTFYLPETCPKKDRHALNMKVIASTYLRKFRNKKIILCSLMTGCGAAIIYLFAAEAPFIGIERIGLSPDQYGLMNFIPPLGLILGSFLANFLSRYKRPLIDILNGSIVTLFFTTLMLILFWLDFVNPWTLFLPMPLIYIGEALMYANASSISLSHAQNKSYASAVIAFVTISSAVVTLFINEALPSEGILRMPVTFTLIAIIMLLLLGCLWRITAKEKATR